jgi:hypothetical protein
MAELLTNAVARLNDVSFDLRVRHATLRGRGVGDMGDTIAVPKVSLCDAINDETQV